MEKYNGFNKLIEDTMNGELCKLDIQYSDENYVEIQVEYRDDTFTYEYIMNIDKESLEVKFISHASLGHFSETRLQRNYKLETEIVAFLFHE